VAQNLNSTVAARDRRLRNATAGWHQIQASTARVGPRVVASDRLLPDRHRIAPPRGLPADLSNLSAGGVHDLVEVCRGSSAHRRDVSAELRHDVLARLLCHQPQDSFDLNWICRGARVVGQPAEYPDRGSDACGLAQ
jgi:hypothetical protein